MSTKLASIELKEKLQFIPSLTDLVIFTGKVIKDIYFMEKHS